MIKAEISSKSMAHRGQLISQAVEFPISRHDLLLAFAKARISNAEDCLIEFEKTQYPNLHRALKVIPQNLKTLEEVNFLSQRLADMRHEARMLMESAIRMTPPDTLKDLINMTYNLDNIVVAPVSTEHELGKFLVENDMVEFPEAAIPYLDFARIGTEHLAECQCVFIGNCYFEDLQIPEEKIEAYDGVTLPGMPQDDWIFRLGLQYADDAGSGENIVILSLPANDRDIEDAIEKAGGRSNFCITALESRIESFQEALNFEETDLDLLNGLAYEIKGMNDMVFVKYMAVLEHERVIPQEYGESAHCNKTLGKLCYFAKDMQNYEFNPCVIDPDDYAKSILYRADIDPVLFGNINYYSYGLAKLRETGAEIGSYGLIRGTAPRQELTPEREQASESEQNQGMNMSMY